MPDKTETQIPVTTPEQILADVLVLHDRVLSLVKLLISENQRRQSIIDSVERNGKI